MTPQKNHQPTNPSACHSRKGGNPIKNKPFRLPTAIIKQAPKWTKIIVNRFTKRIKAIARKYRSKRQKSNKNLRHHRHIPNPRTIRVLLNKWIQNQGDGWLTTPLVVTQECPLKCLTCPLWQDPDAAEESSATFHSRWTSPSLKALITKSAVIDIIGGDPMRHPDLAFFLADLKSQNKQIRLWTTGIFPVENYQPIAPFVDEIYVFFPTANPDTYMELTGYDYFNQIIDTIDFLTESKIPVTLNCPIYPETAWEMPEIQHFARQKSLKICFHYTKSHAYSPETFAYINRYSRIPAIEVLEIAAYPPHQCLAYPDLTANPKTTTLKNTLRRILGTA